MCRSIITRPAGLLYQASVRKARFRFHGAADGAGQASKRGRGTLHSGRVRPARISTGPRDRFTGIVFVPKPLAIAKFCELRNDAGLRRSSFRPDRGDRFSSSVSRANFEHDLAELMGLTGMIRAAWPDPGVAGQARSTASIWRACRAIAKPHSVDSAGPWPGVVFAGSGVHRSTAFVHRRALCEL